MIKITESSQYILYREYEIVYLRIKETDDIIVVGDFYGDVENAGISEDEDFCVMVGCGVIVYFLKPPYIPYEYYKVCDQWIEWFRDGTIWIDDFEIIDQNRISVRLENHESRMLCINQREHKK